MLIIRDSQMRALAEREKHRFTEDTVRSVAERWPQHLAALGEDGVRAAVRAAIDRCEAYGIDEPEDVGAYVAVMFTLGDLEFDRTRAWAATILGERRFDGALKCRELEEGAARELSPDEGDDDEDDEGDDDGGGDA